MKKVILTIAITSISAVMCFAQESSNNIYNPYSQFEGKTKVYIPGENVTYIMDDISSKSISSDRTDFLFDNVIAKVNGNIITESEGQEIIIRRREKRTPILDMYGDKVGVTCAQGGRLCMILITSINNPKLD